MATKFIFEYTTCGRCGGSGSYSYCSMHGSRCFGCKGHGNVLTKRGRAAQNFFEASASKPASEFKPGELIRMTGVIPATGATYTAFERVVSVEAVDPLTDPCKRYVNGELVTKPMLKIESERKGEKCLTYTSPETMYRQGLTAERKQELIAAALEYQSTLTKTGTVAKRKVAA